MSTTTTTTTSDGSARFRDRADAGRRLAARLARYRHEDGVVLGLPRGGVVVAFEVARALTMPLDVLVVRKLGAPLEPELGIGAVAEGGARYVDEELAAEVGASRAAIDAMAKVETAEVERRVRAWRAGKPPRSIEGRLVIVVDDGIATGGTVRVALRALQQRNPGRIVLAVPVAPRSAIAALREDVDDVVCLAEPAFMRAIGEHYDDFTQVDDATVAALLRRAELPFAASIAPSQSSIGEKTMKCSDIMKKDIECLTPSDSVESAARRMRDRNVGFLPVCDDTKRVLGTVTDRDIVVRVLAERKPASTPVDQAMSTEIVSCRPDDDIKIAQERMSEKQKSRILCCDGRGVLVGVISLSDLAHNAKAKDAGRVLSDVTARELRG